MNSGSSGRANPSQERTVVELDRLLDVTAVEGGQEVREIGAEDGRVEANGQRPSVDRVLAEVSADGVEGLMEGVLGPLRVALGPQIEEQPVAGHPRIAPTGEDRQQGEGAGASGCPIRQLGPVFQGQPAEKSKSVSHRSLNWGPSAGALAGPGQGRLHRRMEDLSAV